MLYDTDINKHGYHSNNPSCSMIDTNIFENIAMILMPYDRDIIGIILMLYDTEYSLSCSTISSRKQMHCITVFGPGILYALVISVSVL